jgi:hypothetical protein
MEGAMNKAELIIEGGPGVLFNTLEEAMDAGREMHRSGSNVRIEVFPDEVPGTMTGYSYDRQSDEWFTVQMPVRQAERGST